MDSNVYSFSENTNMAPPTDGMASELNMLGPVQQPRVNFTAMSSSHNLKTPASTTVESTNRKRKMRGGYGKKYTVSNKLMAELNAV